MHGKEKVLKHVFIKASLITTAENGAIHALNKLQPSVKPYQPTCTALPHEPLLARGVEHEFDGLNSALANLAVKYSAS